MNNEIGRKITSLTLMAIMVAGGMTFAMPGMIPVAHAANANLFVSAENSQFDNYMSGPQVIEVVVIDSDINETDEANGEPDVTVNGKILRMIQAIDGNWYGYFADQEQASIADETTTSPGVGLDFGSVCIDGDLADAEGFIGDVDPFDLGDSDGVAIGATACDGTGVNPDLQNVLREAKDLNEESTTTSGTNPPDVNTTAEVWPFIQLYELNPTGNVVVQYNKGGGVQTTTLTFDTAQDFAGIELDRPTYGANQEVSVTITDLWLNIDPTDEDSWTFAANQGDAAARGTYYQVFDENGQQEGDFVDTDTFRLTANVLDDLMCDDNCILFINPNQQNGVDQITLQTNDDSAIEATVGTSDPQVIGDFQTAGGNLAGAYPVTVTEQGPNSGVFSTSDEGDTSALITVNSDNFIRGQSATIDYNDDPLSILTGFTTGSIDIQPIDDEWNSGEEIPVVVDDNDLNQNSRADEDLDLFNPNVDHIPTLQTGNPITLENINSAEVDVGTTELFTAGSDNPEPFSQRVFLETDASTVVGDGNTITFTLDDTFEDLYNSITENGVDDFRGINLINFDVRSVVNTLDADSVDVALRDGPPPSTVTATFTDDAADGLNAGAELTAFAGDTAAIINGGVTITQGGNVVTATFTDDAADGLNAGAELTAFAGDTAAIINGGVTITQGADVVIATDAEAQSLINLDSAGSALFGLNEDSEVQIVLTINGGAGVDIAGESMPVVIDFFSFGFFNDGESASDRVANQIIRLELEETGDNTGLFEGSLEYTMINQLTILDADTYEDLSTIADDPTFIVIEDLTDEDAPRVNYLEIIDDGVPTNRADQQEAPSHSGLVSFDNDNYKVADTVYITLEDADLNTDSDLLEIYTTVSNPTDVTFGAVGEADLPELSFGPLGKLLDVTFDDIIWKTPQGTCDLDGTADTGLDDVTFSMVETQPESGIFVGSFEIPDRWCRADDGSPETTTGLDIEVNYIDFRDASGEIIEVGDSAGVRANTGSISLDRTVYPVPFGVPSNFDTSSETSPDGQIPVPNPSQLEWIQLELIDLIQVYKSGEFLGNGDLHSTSKS